MSVRPGKGQIVFSNFTGMNIFVEIKKIKFHVMNSLIFRNFLQEKNIYAGTKNISD